jgi:hypothetical protein
MRVQHVNAGADGEQAAGVVDLGERRVPVGDAVAVGVDEFDDAALARALAERSVEIDAGVNLALGGDAEGRDARRDIGPEKRVRSDRAGRCRRPAAGAKPDRAR